MKDIETGKFFLWLTGIFPQWKPDPSVAPAWASELPDLTAEQAVLLVRKLQAKKPSPFPPSVFELLAELRGGSKLDARKTWAKVLDRVRRQGQRDYPYDLTETERQAVRLMGGIEVIANSDVGDPFIEKRFLEVCDNLKEENNVLSLNNTSEKRLLGRGKGLRETGDLGGGQAKLAERND